MKSNKKTNIYTESFGFGGNKFRIYSDLSLRQIEQIEGVHSVSDWNLDYEGYLVVVIDKRFDIRKVLSEIKDLAEREASK